MDPATLAALAVKHWRAIALGLLLGFAGLQTARLGHAKADQLDRTACVKGSPCKPVKWRAEVEALQGQVGDLQAQRDQCRTDASTLKAAIEAQNAAAAALKAQGDKRIAQAGQAAQAARAVAESARQASAVLQVRQLVGANVCDRVADAQAAFLEVTK